MARNHEKKHGGWKKQRMRVWKKKVSMPIHLCLFTSTCASVSLFVSYVFHLLLFVSICFS